MIKLIVSDFDGTILPYNQKNVSEEVIFKIKSLLKKNIAFAVSSGRTYSELITFFPELKDDIFFICDDGAVTVKNKAVIFNKPISKSAIKTVFDNSSFESLTFYSLENVYSHNEENVLTLGKTKKNISRIFEIKDEIYKIVAKGSEKKSFEFPGIRVHYSNEGVYEFVSAFANKGISLIDLQMHLGISKYETVVIGDASNDVPMARNARYSICIDKKSEALMKQSKYNVDSISDAFKIILNE